MMKDLAGVWLLAYQVSWAGSFAFTNVYAPSSNYTAYLAFTATGGYAATNYTNGARYSSIEGTYTVDAASNIGISYGSVYCGTNSNVILTGLVTGSMGRFISSLTAGVNVQSTGKVSVREQLAGTCYVYTDQFLTSLVTNYPTNMGYSTAYGDDRDFYLFAYQ